MRIAIAGASGLLGRATADQWMDWGATAFVRAAVLPFGVNSQRPSSSTSSPFSMSRRLSA